MSIGTPLQPGHWSYDSAEREWKGPEPYFFNFAGPFGAFQGELHWTLNIFIELHQHAYSSFRRHDGKLDAMVVGLKADNAITSDANDENEAMLVAKYRRLDYINAADVDLRRSVRTINRMYVVSLWALAEQYLGKIYQKLRALRTATLPESIAAPYRWDDLKSKYTVEGIDLTSLQDFEIANECRVLNNHIKHDPTVSSKLAAFTPFNGRIGADLNEVDLDPQRYLNGVSNFLSSLIERSNAIHTTDS